jgi:hypothetical protein
VLILKGLIPRFCTNYTSVDFEQLNLKSEVEDFMERKVGTPDVSPEMKKAAFKPPQFEKFRSLNCCEHNKGPK